MKNESRMYYLAYGSNMHLGQMAHRCPAARVVGQTTLEGYRLVFRGGYTGAVATIEPAKGYSVPVLIWEITDRHHVALDRYEGWPRFYEKQLLIVELEGQPVPAMVYVMAAGHEYGSPSIHYFNTIKVGYEGAGFDLDILNEAAEYSAELAGEIE